MKILLNTANSIKSSQTDNNVSINFENKSKLLPFGDNMDDVVNAYELYENEINSCYNYRLIFNIEPICSNVLYNPISIIIDNSNNNILAIDQQNAAIFGQSGNTVYDLYYDGNVNYNTIKQCSGYTIYCGLDVFDNHLFRSDTFKITNSLIDKDPVTYKHVYTMDDIVSFPQSIENNLIEDNGWVGFKNPGKIALYDSGSTGSYTLNQKRFINGLNNVCDFIDLYPTRDLFLFKPKIKVNSDNTREIENNWNYYLTYPSSSDNTNFLIHDDYFGNGLPLMSFYQVTSLTQETLCVCKVPYSHNLSVNDMVQITIEIRDSGTTIPYIKQYQSIIYNVGDESGNDLQHFFIIKGFTDYNKTSFYYIKNGYYGNFGGRVRKIKNSLLSQYYIRKFSLLPSSHNNQVIRNNVNDLAFASTIYSDKISQIIYNDDINIESLVDNRNRPLTELYLTLLKRNETNESSSCFGKVTSAYDLLDLNDFAEIISYGQVNPIEKFISNTSISGYTSYSNIHYINNIPLNQTYTVIDPTTVVPKRICNNTSYANFEFYFTQSTTPIENNVISGASEFYGDIVEFIPIQDSEVQLEPIYHRFNTIQRESILEKDCVLTFNDILMDDFSVDDTVLARQAIDGITNSYDEEPTDECSHTNGKFVYRSKLTVGPRPEGYYYSPHNKIQIKEFNSDLQQSNYYLYISLSGGNTRQFSYNKIGIYIEFTLLNNLTHSMSTGDSIRIITKDDNSNIIVDNTYIVYVTSGDNTSFKILYDNDLYNSLIYYNFSIKYYTQDTPIYATDLEDGRCIWHEILDNSKLTNDVVFSNNALYFSNNIKLYLHRQDPFGKYGLLYSSWPNDLYGEQYGLSTTITDKAINNQC